MAVVGAGLHDTSVVRLTVGMPGGDVTWIGIEESSGRAVWATLITRGAVDGEPTLKGWSPPLPAEATTVTPSLAASLTARVESSSGWP